MQRGRRSHRSEGWRCHAESAWGRGGALPREREGGKGGRRAGHTPHIAGQTGAGAPVGPGPGPDPPGASSVRGVIRRLKKTSETN